MNTEDQTTDIALSEDQENAQVEIIVSASLANINSNREKLEEVATQYKGIKIDGIDDKANYKIVSAGITATRSGRTTVAKLVKGGKSLLDKAKKRLDEEGEALIAIVSPVEQELKTEKERIDTLKQEAEDERLRVLEEEKQARIAKLFDLGLTFNGSYYQIADLTLTPIQVIQFSEAQFEGFVSQAKVVFEAEQLRIADEKEKEEKRIADEKAENERLAEVTRKAQELLTQENAEKQLELDAINHEREIMRHERTEYRVETLKRHEFTGDLKVGSMTRANFILKAEFIVDATKSDWDAKMKEFEAYLVTTEEAEKKKSTTIPPAIQAMVDSGKVELKPANTHDQFFDPSKNGSAIKFTEEQRESILNDVLVAEEAVKGDFTVKSFSYTAHTEFTSEVPFIDKPIGKSIFRVYIEQTMDAAQDGLTPDMVAASGSIGDELLFLVIKGK